MSNVLDRFLKYIQFDTTSDENSSTVPSTKSQLEFAKIIGEELEEIGLKNVSIDNNGYVMATLPSNIEKEVPTIGFIAHMDTSPDISGKDISPKIIKNYDGKDIILNEDENIVLSVDAFPDIKNYIGEDLITTDGTTLLGADNKAGVAEIITAMEFLINNPDIPHGTVKIGFTPDEEIGRGADHFDVEKFGADHAYTIDGGPIGELEYENFNAGTAKISIKGTNIHPGSAKNMMVNSILIGTELNSMLPTNEKPEYTEKYEGFYHLISYEGSVENTDMTYILRDHDIERFEKQKETLEQIVEFLNYKYDNVITLKIEDSYYNMKEKILPVIDIVNTVEKAMKELEIEPIISPIRGGTDGARLSYMGLPCPNIFTGGHNFHGRFEYIPVFAMEKATQLILKTIEIYAK